MFFKRTLIGGHIAPARDWFVVLAVAAIAVIASLAWNVWFFWSTVREEITDVAANTGNDADANLITQVEELFLVRDREANQYRSEFIFVDPSR